MKSDFDRRNRFEFCTCTYFPKPIGLWHIRFEINAQYLRFFSVCTSDGRPCCKYTLPADRRTESTELSHISIGALRTAKSTFRVYVCRILCMCVWKCCALDFTCACDANVCVCELWICVDFSHTIVVVVVVQQMYKNIRFSFSVGISSTAYTMWAAHKPTDIHTVVRVRINSVHMHTTENNKNNSE